MSNVRDELQRWVDGVDATHEDGLADLTHDVIPVDLARRVLADLDSGRDELEATRGYAGEMARKAEAAQFDIEDADQRRDDWKSRWQEAVRHADEAFAERDAAIATLAEVRAEHQPDGDYGYQTECVACGTQWPCTTTAILDRSTP